MEYLLTYAWALVAIASIVGVLVFVMSGNVNTNTCTTFLSLICKGIVADGDTLVMVLQNSTGQKISITPFEDICFNGVCGYATIEYQGKEYWFETVEIGAGEQFKIFGTGQALATQISITYTEQTTEANGKVSFTFKEKGDYTIYVTKNLYTQNSKTITINECTEGQKPEQPTGNQKENTLGEQAQAGQETQNSEQAEQAQETKTGFFSLENNSERTTIAILAGACAAIILGMALYVKGRKKKK